MTTAANVITFLRPEGGVETWRPTTLDKLGKHEDFLEENLARTPELIGLVSRRTGIHEPFVVFRQLSLDTPSGGQVYPDIVLLAASGHVIVVEVKLSVNSELRNRAVIAQIVDYASSFSALDDEQLVRVFGEDQGVNSWFDLVQALFPADPNSEELAETLRNRIAEGEINLVIACDRIPPGVPDVVRGISSQETLAFDLDLVEVRPFVREETDTTEILFVPTTRLATEIVSRTAVSVTYRQGDQQPSTNVEIVQVAEPGERGDRKWTPGEVEEEFAKVENPVALAVLEFARQHSADGKFIPSGRRKNANIHFNVKTRDPNGKPILQVLFSSTAGWGSVYFNLKLVSQHVDGPVVLEFQERLSDAFDVTSQPGTVWVSVHFDRISGKVDRFKEIVLWIASEVEKTG